MHHSPAVTGPAVQWDVPEATVPHGLLGLSEPNVHRFGDRWCTFVGGFSTSFRNRLYRAALPVGADVRPTGWRIDSSARGRPLVLAPDAPRGARDAGGAPPAARRRAAPRPRRTPTPPANDVCLSRLFREVRTANA
ncbi:hypothetical protein KGD83_17275 [Nocardiopsis akebiae]|uniref:Uncharacterized protein n=1 Tax=Nocardiopsis akebiae TaxID=2831968 RepID=A0ABX8BY24_9ACTN|nr:hypothetical protein [Nocardiopsis akebiae]QUX27092.1 hypothetical protein KGD83_17275 [Nocardiopsis akebiae]